ncbi:hypothetical protein JHK86_050787 [Glycine max]|nr:hypothetical protein JHK86_050787 [Glycine max]
MRSGSFPPPYVRCLSFIFSPNPSTSDTVIFVDDSRSLVVSDTRVVDPFIAPNTLLSSELASLQWRLSLISTKRSRNQLTLHHRNPNLLPLYLRSVLLLTGHNDFLERFFEFVYKHNGFLATESTEKEIVSLVRVTEKKREFLKGEREKAKKKKKREDLKASEEREKSNKRLKEEKEPKIEDTNKDESASRVQNKGNGLDLEKYSWTQSLQEVNVNVPVPNGTKSRFVTVKIKNHLKVGFKGLLPIVEVNTALVSIREVKTSDGACYLVYPNPRCKMVFGGSQKNMVITMRLITLEPFFLKLARVGATQRLGENGLLTADATNKVVLIANIYLLKYHEDIPSLIEELLLLP